ncbi:MULTISPECIES: DUF7313 family protein [Halolamina]|uniref:DUF7313 domain-containing protein n=1 Tax=Halolamina pelagica TaxID=699431 RepID=A0A1I5R771_9EURY|nr:MULTISPECIES: hypothetical protein [Halolamina]NHX35719.1 hypothetical protein [Halolamina sp. R1-12]SFP54369.1 hypothetical protein SAMN05216277_104273 [Halolamina pelagica]
MTPLQFAVPIGALESISGAFPYVILGLVVANLLTRHLAYRRYKRAAEGGADTLSRYTPHVAVSALAILVSLLYLVIEPHSGMVISVLVVGTFVADVFEFEARQVEARNNLEIEKPKGAITASVVALLYALYIALFWVIEGPWEAIV